MNNTRLKIWLCGLVNHGFHDIGNKQKLMSNPRPFRFASGVLHIFLPRDTIKINISKQKRPSQLMTLFNYHYPENLMNNRGSTMELWKRPRQQRTERLLKISIFNKEKQRFCTLRTSVVVHFTVVLFLPSTSNDCFAVSRTMQAPWPEILTFFCFLFPKRPQQFNSTTLNYNTRFANQMAPFTM